MTRRVSGWILACAALVLPFAVAAQVTMQPAQRPLVTAENERWYMNGDPITFSGSFYYPAGAQVYFNPYEMVRTGNYMGIPLYARTTLEPYSVIYVPVAGGLMQPYERRREGDVAGTVGSMAPSFPVRPGTEGAGAFEAAAPPYQGRPYVEYLPTDERAAERERPAATTGVSSVPPVQGPLRTAKSPVGLNGFFIEYDGQRWFSSGPAVEFDPARFTRVGQYHGFPVYASTDRKEQTVYVAVGDGIADLLAPYSVRK